MINGQITSPDGWYYSYLHLFSKKDKEEEKKKNGDPTDQRPQREEHKKDEAIEEFVEPNPNEKPPSGKEDSAGEDGMGISEKAKKQSSDESDRYKDK